MSEIPADEAGKARPAPAERIVDKLNAAYEAGETTTSFEFFPAKVGHPARAHGGASRRRGSRMCVCVPQTRAGVANLLRRIERMGLELSPTFVTLTWRSAFKVPRCAGRCAAAGSAGVAHRRCARRRTTSCGWTLASACRRT